MTRLRLIAAGVAATTLTYAFSAATQAQAPAPIAAEAEASKPDADMAQVLSALAALEPKPIENLTPAEARKQPTPADAVKQVIKDRKLKVDPHKGLDISNQRFADMGNLRLRWYVPDGAGKDANLPVVLFFRGGGWVIADLDTYDATPSALARKLGAAVVSIDYPMAPENKFPAAHNEAIEAYKYILKNAQGWDYNPGKVALVGESAGGNLAINTAIAARDRGLAKPVAIVAVYPVAATDPGTSLKKSQVSAKPLNTAMLTWFFSHVLASPSEQQDPRLNLVAADLKGLPPVTVINADIDPLRSDGDLLVEKLKADGVDTAHKLFTGVTHEFFDMDAVVAKAAEAQDFAVAQIKKGFGQ